MRRDLFKTISFAVLHFAVGFGVSYAFTGSLVIAGGIALIEPLANTVVFYFHERAWRRLDRKAEHRSLGIGRVSWQPRLSTLRIPVEGCRNYPGNCV